MFKCSILDGRRLRAVDVEVLDSPRGNIAIQSQIDDTLMAVEVTAPATWFRLHEGAACKGAFSRAPGAGRKVRS